VRLLLFAVLTALLAFVSRGPLGVPGSHGFYRFFGWEGMLALLLLNFGGVGPWFADAFSLRQLISWVLLFGSLVPALLGAHELLRRGAVSRHRDDAALFDFEKTTRLVTTGVYRWIRHPLYASLLMLTWGVFWKRPSWVGCALAAAASAFLVATAQAEEAENVRYFGDAYRDYRRATRMFIPGLF